MSYDNDNDVVFQSMPSGTSTIQQRGAVGMNKSGKTFKSSGKTSSSLYYSKSSKSISSSNSTSKYVSVSISSSNSTSRSEESAK